MGVPLVVAALWLQLWPLPAARAASFTVTLSDNAYSPASITIQPGDTVVWKVPPTLIGSCHSVSADDGHYGSSILSAGILCIGGGAQSYSHTYPAAGVYRYHCSVVAGMTGVVTVAAPTPTPSPTPSPLPSLSPSPSPSPSPSSTPSPSPSVSASPSTSASPSASTSPFVVPTTSNSGLAAGSGGGKGGPSGPAVVAIIAGLVALASAAGLIALRRSGAW